MEKRKLGENGNLVVSAVGFGCMGMSFGYGPAVEKQQGVSHSGQIGIEDLTRELGCSRRQLDRKFRERIGVSPKNMASVLRFQAVYRCLRRKAASGARYDRFDYDP